MPAKNAHIPTGGKVPFRLGYVEKEQIWRWFMQMANFSGTKISIFLHLSRGAGKKYFLAF
jgi:hypothetical protein